METVNVGHKIEMAIAFLDQNGNPMQTTPVPDAPGPSWTNAPAPAGCDTLVAAVGGLTAELDALAPGQDTVSLSLNVGSKTFTASLAVTIAAAPQVLTSIAIVPTVV